MPRAHAEPPKRDAFVADVVEDPKAPPDAMLLSGFVGDSPEPNHTRLYLEAELRSYVDIPNNAVLHSKPIPAESSALGGSFLWIKRDAELLYHTSARLEARFLEGRIASAYGGGAVRRPFGHGGQPATVAQTACLPCAPGQLPPLVLTVGACGGETVGCLFVGSSAGCVIGELGGDLAGLRGSGG